MAKRKVIQDKTTESIDKKINPHGLGEDAAVRDLVSGKLATMSNLDAAELAMALQQIIRGENSLLAQQMSGEIAKLRERMDNMDKAAAKFENDKKKFLEEAHEALEKARGSSDPDTERARGANILQSEIKKARAKLATDLLQFEHELATMPQEMVMSPGDPKLVSVNGKPTMRMFPEVIHIKNKTWTLQPGKPTLVPRIVAEALRQRMASKQEDIAMREAMSSNLEMGKLDQTLTTIRKEHEVPYDPSAVAATKK